jgi:hypothetical protein
MVQTGEWTSEFVGHSRKLAGAPGLVRTWGLTGTKAATRSCVVDAGYPATRTWPGPGCRHFAYHQNLPRWARLLIPRPFGSTPPYRPPQWFSRTVCDLSCSTRACSRRGIRVHPGATVQSRAKTVASGSTPPDATPSLPQVRERCRGILPDVVGRAQPASQTSSPKPSSGPTHFSRDRLLTPRSDWGAKISPFAWL